MASRGRRSCRCCARPTAIFERGRFIGDTRQTVEQYLASWLELKRHEVKSGTWQCYEIVVRRYIAPLIGKVKLT